MIQVPSHSRVLLGATVMYAVAFFFWLSLEDVTLTGVVATGVAGALVLTAHIARARWGGHKLERGQAVGLWTVLGLIAGLLSAPYTALLMVSKVGLHAHAYPDFTVQQVAGVLRVWPVWAMAGTVFGLALGAGVYLWPRPPDSP